ncbi:MAG: ABC transporter permease [Candidatus Hydrogenedentes bacterium]|jgi:ABC-type polysaccharide/polyol phosphate export permease|nr:ABC transporter permease [Candidatus Hydrogenedentota bacterium]
MMHTPVYDSRCEGSFLRLPRDLIRARELLISLVWKDLRVRYRYAVMGFLWAIIEPLAFTLILSFVFSFVFGQRIASDAGSAGPPYAVVLLCGLIFWQYFSLSLTSATTSVVTNGNLIKKVRFAREVIPISACCMPLVQLGLGFIMLIIAHLIMGGNLGFTILYVLPLFAIQFILTLGLALFLACFHVHYRDVGNLVNVLLLLFFYGTPVFYPLELVRSAPLPQWIKTLYMANPMTGLLTGYRQILFEQRFPETALILWPLLCAVAAILTGSWLFRRFSTTMADYI